MTEIAATSREHTVYLALGSNLGNRQEHLATAITGLRKTVDLDAISSLYETEPIGYLEQPRFLNMVCRGKTQLSPQDLLIYAKALEQAGGRQTTLRNGPRTIDIDILLYDHAKITQRDLVIPHPRMSTRAFVLIPLAEIAPDLVEPNSGKTIHELLTTISKQGVQKFV
jgi:2-amino-4-hydroxy-6-hydroxymethyldihydropteridine diphosphokinase